MMEFASSWRRSYTFILCSTIAVVALADYFFYDHPVGWPAAILAGAMLALLATRSMRFLATTGGRVVALAAIGLLVALIEQPTLLNVCYVLVCLSALALTNSLGWDNDFTRWLGRFARWFNNSWAGLFLDNGLVVRWLVRHGLPPGVARTVAAWTVPVLASSVFVALFAWANPVISDFFSSFGTWISSVFVTLPEYLNLLRILFWTPFAIVAWMLLRGRVRRKRRSPYPPYLPVELRATFVVQPKPVVVDQPSRPISAAFVIRCLVLFNLVFLVENALDTKFLWVEGELPHRLEYREYVRRGAYPLVAAALLAGAFVLTTFRPGSETERSTAARRLVYAWIAQTILLTISAAWRLGRYVEISELTRLRVASVIWFALVALGLSYIIWRIVSGRSNKWLINVNAITALLVLYPCCFINFDGMIASFNAGHCSEAGGRGSPLDLEYFRTLGPAAVPALDRVLPAITAQSRREFAQEISDELHADLREQMTDWRGWTWRRHRIAQASDEQMLARVNQTTQHIVAAVPVIESQAVDPAR